MTFLVQYLNYEQLQTETKEFSVLLQILSSVNPLNTELNPICQ